MGALLFGATAWALRGVGLHTLGFVGISAAVACLSAFALMVARAMERDRLVQYWLDRRELRLALRHERAHRIMLADALKVAQSDPDAEVDSALGAMVDKVHEALAAVDDDRSVAAAVEEDGRLLILHSASDPGSRWRGLRAGKSCPLSHASFEGILKELAPHWHAVTVTAAEEDLLIAVLSRTPFRDEETEVLRSVELCFAPIAKRWMRSTEPSSPANARHLRTVS